MWVMLGHAKVLVFLVLQWERWFKAWEQHANLEMFGPDLVFDELMPKNASTFFTP